MYMFVYVCIYIYVADSTVDILFAFLSRCSCMSEGRSFSLGIVFTYKACFVITTQLLLYFESHSADSQRGQLNGEGEIVNLFRQSSCNMPGPGV